MKRRLSIWTVTASMCPDDKMPSDLGKCRGTSYVPRTCPDLGPKIGPDTEIDQENEGERAPILKENETPGQHIESNCLYSDISMCPIVPLCAPGHGQGNRAPCPSLRSRRGMVGTVDSADRRS